MATPLDQSKLLEEEDSSEDSFEHVDNPFEEEYEELKGRATADYLPLEKGEILVRKGDIVTVREQTLDGNSFLIVKCATGEEGKIPVDYIDIDYNDGTESSLDNGVRRKQDPRAGIVRRPGVSKLRGSPLRRAYRLSSEDKAALIASLPSEEGGSENPSGQSNLEGTPASQPGSAGVGSLNVPPGGLARPKSWDPSVGRLQSSLPAGDSSSLAFRERHPPPTRDLRAHTVNLLPELPPEYKRIERYNIMSVSGADRDGRLVIVLSACRLPPSYHINHQRLLEYILLTLNKYVEQDYTLVYFHYGFSSLNKPSFSWLHQVYRELDRKYKKNVKKLYIVHPTNFIRILMTLFKPIISYKFGRKVAYINRLDELKPVLFLDQIDIPEEVKRYDAQLTTPVRDVVKTDSKSVFHVPQYDPRVEPSVLATKQFGVPLEVLKERSGGDEIPLVLRTCTDFLEQRGLDVLGIFRRTPSNVLVHQIKGRFDAGDKMDFAEYGDPHLAAVVMKLFLRELPEPVLTFDAYSHITELRGKNQDVRLHKCQEIVGNLPQINYDVLKYLIAFTRKVADHQEVNKMTPLNLAIVFGPNLVWSQSEVASLTSLGEVNTFTLILITNFDQIFTK